MHRRDGGYYHTNTHFHSPSLSLTYTLNHRRGGLPNQPPATILSCHSLSPGVIDEDEGRPDCGGSRRSTSRRLMWNNIMWTMFMLDPCCCGTSNLMAKTYRADAVVRRLASESNLIGFWVSEPFGSAELDTNFKFGRSQIVFLV